MSDWRLEIREARRAADRLYDRTATPSDLRAVRDTLAGAGEEIERLCAQLQTAREALEEIAKGPKCYSDPGHVDRARGALAAFQRGEHG